jgi:DNA replication and repair protein RecF
VGARDFRNLERAEAELGEGITVVHGPNGAGKTNLLEALYFGCTARSCRTSNERELLRFGAQVARVEVAVQAEDGPHLLEVGLEPGAAKRVRVDGALLDGPASAEVRPLVSVFMPDRLDLVKGAPALRRAHLDQVVTALWPARNATRTGYSRALAQRNALIARVRSGAARPELLDQWDSELARAGAALMADRAEAASLVAPRFAERAGELGLPDDAMLAYRPRSRAADAEGLRQELGERREEDLARGFSAHGPHRDELALSHGARALRAYGSQGQQRLGLLALLFAERDVLLEARGRPPLMLLDDVMSELDSARRERLVELLAEGGQALITTTDLDHVPGADLTAIAVMGGSLQREAAAVRGARTVAAGARAGHHARPGSGGLGRRRRRGCRGRGAARVGARRHGHLRLPFLCLGGRVDPHGEGPCRASQRGARSVRGGGPGA